MTNKIIVDEIPKDANNCLFLEHLCNCKLNNRSCKLIYYGECDKLKSITDFHAEKEVIE